jgi:hypothetical protein
VLSGRVEQDLELGHRIAQSNPVALPRGLFFAAQELKLPVSRHNRRDQTSRQRRRRSRPDTIE